MNFQQQLSSELKAIIEDLERGDRGRGSEPTAMRLLSLIETALLNGDISLESVDLMNQARQQLTPASYGETSSFTSYQAPIQSGEGRRGRPKFVIPEQQLVFFKGNSKTNKIKSHVFYSPFMLHAMTKTMKLIFYRKSFQPSRDSYDARCEQAYS